MTSLPSSVDVAIIGAGAAGLGAAHALKDSGLSSSCWKRATASADAATPSWPRPKSPSTSAAAGCIRPTRTVLSPIAEQLGFEIDKTLPPWRERACGKAFPQDERAEFIRSLDEFFERVEDAAKSGRDSAGQHSISSPAIAGIR